MIRNVYKTYIENRYNISVSQGKIQSKKNIKLNEDKYFFIYRSVTQARTYG